MELATYPITRKTVTIIVVVILHYPEDPEDAIFMSRLSTL